MADVLARRPSLEPDFAFSLYVFGMGGKKLLVNNK